MTAVQLQLVAAARMRFSSTSFRQCIAGGGGLQLAVHQQAACGGGRRAAASRCAAGRRAGVTDCSKNVVLRACHVHPPAANPMCMP